MPVRPAHTVPARFVPVDAIPRIADGTIDLKALVAPTVDVPSGGTEEEEGGDNALVVVVVAVGGVAAVVGGVLCYLKLDAKKRRGVAMKSAAPPSDAV